MEEKVLNIGAGDARASKAADEIYNFIMERAEGLPVPTVIGMLELIKYQIFMEFHFIRRLCRFCKGVNF